MKQKVISQKFLFFIAILCMFAMLFLFFIKPTSQPAFAETQTTFYARAVGSNVKLYRSTQGGEETNNIYFTIPQSYFVQIDQCDDDLFYRASYLGTSGFVKKSDVQCVSGYPQTPYATASFRVFIPGGVELRSSPTQSEGLNIVCELDFMETNLQYYGSIDGEEAISHKSSTWFYCKYIKNGKENFGYVYSAYCDLLTTIPTNTETLELIDEPDFTIETATPPSESKESIDSLPSSTQIIIIVAVCLPCIVIIYLLFRPTKIAARAMEEAETKSLRKTKKKKSRHQDYYEYEEWAAFVMLFITPFKKLTSSIHSQALLFVSKNSLLE